MAPRRKVQQRFPPSQAEAITACGEAESGGGAMLDVSMGGIKRWLMMANPILKWMVYTYK